MTTEVRNVLYTMPWLLVAASLTACVSGKRGGTTEHEEFLAGQEEAFNMLERSGIAVVRVVGPFQHPVVTWREGLTVSEVILEAGYLETRDPTQILVQRSGTVMAVDPESLLLGRDLAVESGDVVHVLP